MLLFIKHFFNFFLLEFAVKDSELDDYLIDHQDSPYCYYRGFRHPPDHENKYQPTLEYWYYLAVKCLYFIILEVTKK